jgi:hypothetical protein
VNPAINSDDATVQVGVRMPAALWKATRRLAIDKDTSGQGIVILALQAYIKQNGGG